MIATFYFNFEIDIVSIKLKFVNVKDISKRNFESNKCIKIVKFTQNSANAIHKNMLTRENKNMNSF